MKTTEKNIAQAQELGFNKLETIEIVKQLNIALSTYQVFFHKLQNFHWNIVGSDFFDVHDLTEELYRLALNDIDEIAERVRVFGQTPYGRLNEYLKHSLIKESSSEKSAEFMFYELISDIQRLTESLLEAHEYAAANGDIGSTYMLSGMLKKLETHHWQMSAWADRKFKS